MRRKDLPHCQGLLTRYQRLDALPSDQGLLVGDLLCLLRCEPWRVGLEARHLPFRRIDIPAVGENDRVLAAYTDYPIEHVGPDNRWKDMLLENLAGAVEIMHEDEVVGGILSDADLNRPGFCGGSTL